MVVRRGTASAAEVKLGFNSAAPVFCGLMASFFHCNLYVCYLALMVSTAT